MTKQPPIDGSERSPRKEGFTAAEQAQGGGRGPDVKVEVSRREGSSGGVESEEAALSPAELIALALLPEQRTAIEKMLSGHTLVASATAAGVTRMTLYRWLHHDPKFQAAYNAWQLDAITGAQTKLLAMTNTAVNTVGQAIRTDAKVAITLLKSVGALDRPRPGSTDPEEVKTLMEIAAMYHKNRMDEEYFNAKNLHGTGPGVPGDVGLGGAGKGGKGLSEAELAELMAAAEKEFGGKGK